MARKTTSLKTEQKTQNSSAQHSTRLGKRLPPVRCLRLAARSREPDFEKVRSRAGGQERQESQEFAFRGSCGLELQEILSAKAVAARTPNFEEAVLRQVGGVMRGGVGRHSQTLSLSCPTRCPLPWPTWDLPALLRWCPGRGTRVLEVQEQRRSTRRVRDSQDGFEPQQDYCGD